MKAAHRSTTSLGADPVKANGQLSGNPGSHVSFARHFPWARGEADFNLYFRRCGQACLETAGCTESAEQQSMLSPVSPYLLAAEKAEHIRIPTKLTQLFFVTSRDVGFVSGKPQIVPQYCRCRASSPCIMYGAV